MNTTMTRVAAAVGGLAIATSVVVSCAETQDRAKDIASSAASAGSSAARVAGSAASSGARVASSIASSGASAAGSIASSGASVAGSAASSGANVASSVVSSVLNGAPNAAPGKAIAAETVEKTSSKWWWIPVGVAVAALLAGLMRLLTRRKAEPVEVERGNYPN